MIPPPQRHRATNPLSQWRVHPSRAIPDWGRGRDRGGRDQMVPIPRRILRASQGTGVWHEDCFYPGGFFSTLASA
jgi:hypothetical protein